MAKIMEGKPISASGIVDQVVELSFDDWGSCDVLAGNRVLQAVSSLAADVARRHAGCECVLQGIDSVRFKHAVQREDTVFGHASVRRTWDLFLEIAVKVMAEDFRTLEHREILSAYFTFAARDEN